MQGEPWKQVDSCDGFESHCTEQKSSEWQQSLPASMKYAHSEWLPALTKHAHGCVFLESHRGSEWSVFRLECIPASHWLFRLSHTRLLFLQSPWECTRSVFPQHSSRWWFFPWGLFQWLSSLSIQLLPFQWALVSLFQLVSKQFIFFRRAHIQLCFQQAFPLQLRWLCWRCLSAQFPPSPIAEVAPHDAWFWCDAMLSHSPLSQSLRGVHSPLPLQGHCLLGISNPFERIPWQPQESLRLIVSY